MRCGKKPGIYTSWDECKENVHGFGGAEFKSFSTMAEAERFMLGIKADITQKARGDAAVAYVDGSYNIKTTEFSYGAVIFINGDIIEKSDSFCDKELSSMRNVAGEIKGAEAAMDYCVKEGITKLDLYYDYQGIEKWCTGEWQATKLGTKKYKQYYDTIKHRLDVRFIKVKGHSGDKYNDRADELAKLALGIGCERSLIERNE